MSNTALEILKLVFGFDEFKPGQEDVINALVAGHSAAAIFPTGGGKSLCYQLPALMFDGLTVVVSPLIALMKDQLDILLERGVNAARLDSSLDAEAYKQVMTDLRSGALKLLYVSPERFNNERFRASLVNVPVSLFAVDEAHCVSEWGHNFRPDYLKLARFAETCGAKQILALTATAPPKVVKDIRDAFNIAPENVVNTGFYRPNLTVLAEDVSINQRDPILINRLRESTPGPTVVYVTLQRTAERVAELLTKEGFPCKAYHAGMTGENRASVQDWFMASDDGIVAATIAFGMGIDKDNIRNIIHYNMPKSLENFAQEIGRAGRDGKPASCRMLVSGEDLPVLENFIFGDTPSLHSVTALVNDLFSRREAFDVSYITLSYRHDIRLLVLRTLITYLELDGYLLSGTPFYSVYRFKPLMPSKQILAGFDETRRDFLKALFRCAEKAKTWFDIDINATAKTIGCDRDRIVKALDYLAEAQMLELSVSRIRHRFSRLRAPDCKEELANYLYQRALDRETSEIERLHQVTQLTATQDCIVSFLNSYFGESLEGPCGHCSRCLGEAPCDKLKQRGHPIDNHLLDESMRVLKAHPDIFYDPRACARFLCGVHSPKSSRSKLFKKKPFAVFERSSFLQVLESVEARF